MNWCLEYSTVQNKYSIRTMLYILRAFITIPFLFSYISGYITTIITGKFLMNSDSPSKDY